MAETGKINKILAKRELINKYNILGGINQ